MPWSETKDPYKIWISEIILQQTRVAQGWSYYERFIEKFPDLHALFDAGESEVLKSWEGLGYYSRARNIYKCATQIMTHSNGEFPQSYESLLKLPGIGPYTAAAIASFAFEEAIPVIDGNVIRFIARLLALKNPHQDKKDQKKISEFVSKAIHFGLPSTFNQAIMNMGALVCKPQSPDCQNCPFQNDCLAFLHQKVSEIPEPKIKPTKKVRHFHYFILENEEAGDWAIHQRKTKDIWHGLYEFPLIETENPDVNALPDIIKTTKTNKLTIPEPFFTSRQALTHQEIHFSFYHMYLNKNQILSTNKYIWVKKENISSYPLPVTLKKLVSNLL